MKTALRSLEIIEAEPESPIGLGLSHTPREIPSARVVQFFAFVFSIVLHLMILPYC